MWEVTNFHLGYRPFTFRLSICKPPLIKLWSFAKSQTSFMYSLYLWSLNFLGKSPFLFSRIPITFLLKGTVIIFPVFTCVNSINGLLFSYLIISLVNLKKSETLCPVSQDIINQSRAFNKCSSKIILHFSIWIISFKSK